MISFASLHRKLYIYQPFYRYLSLTCVLHNKEIKFGEECRELMVQGLDILADAVALTLGPKGRNVILEQYKDDPKITKDGLTVAESIDLRNRFQNVGVKLLQEVAKNTNKNAGDGISTATVLARTIAKEGIKSIGSGCSVNQLRKGVIMATNSIKDTLKSISKPISTLEEIAQAATISANGDKEIGSVIAEAMSKVGKKGVITINAGKTVKDMIEVTKGMMFDKGYISPYFINVKKNAKVEFKNPYILFCETKISELKSIISALELSHNRKRPLVIIAEDVEGEALTGIVINKIQIGLEVCAIKAPGFGEVRKEILKDMAILTGGTVFGDEADIDIEDVKFEHFGRAGEVIVTKGETFIIKGMGKKDEIENRISHVDYLISHAKNDFIKEGLEERKGRLDTGVAVIYTGGYSELDVGERKDRMTDALNATRAAIAEGIVAGGGTALVRCIDSLSKLQVANDDQRRGINIMQKALLVPCYTIAQNAGLEGVLVVNKVLDSKGNIGFNVLTNKYTDLVEDGIIDAAKVVRTAVESAGGVATLITATEAVIAPREKENKLIRSEEDDEEDSDEEPQIAFKAQ